MLWWERIPRATGAYSLWKHTCGTHWFVFRFVISGGGNQRMLSAEFSISSIGTLCARRRGTFAVMHAHWTKNHPHPHPRTHTPTPTPSVDTHTRGPLPAARWACSPPIPTSPLHPIHPPPVPLWTQGVAARTHTRGRLSEKRRGGMGVAEAAAAHLLMRRQLPILLIHADPRACGRLQRRRHRARPAARPARAARCVRTMQALFLVSNLF